MSADSQLALEQLAAQDDAALFPIAQDPLQFSKHPVFAQDSLLGQVHEEAASFPTAHDPLQFSKHPVFAQDSLLGQVHDPAAPRANPIPAISRTIEAIASLFILHHSTHHFERWTFRTVGGHYSI